MAISNPGDSTLLAFSQRQGKITHLVRFAVVSLCLLCGKAGAAVLTVGPEGSAPYTEIQAALDAASVNDTIQVLPGQYAGPVRVIKPLKLISTDGPMVTVLRPDSADGGVVDVTAPDFTLEGFTIEGGSYGVRLSGARNAHIANNVLRSNRYYSYGIQIFQRSNDNRIIGNHFEGQHFGIFVTHDSRGNRIEGGVIRDTNFGLYGSVLNGLQVVGVQFLQNRWHGLYLEGSGARNVTVVGNDFVGNGVGASINGTDGNRAYNNNFIDNTTHAQAAATVVWAAPYPQAGNYWSDWTGPDRNGDGVVDDARPVGDGYDPYPLAAPGGWDAVQPVLYVHNRITDRSYPNIQQALDEAYAGDELVIDPVDADGAQGLKAYHENVVISTPVTLRGSGAGQTLLHALDRNGSGITIRAAGTAVSDLSVIDAYRGVDIDGARDVRVADTHIAGGIYYNTGILVRNRAENALLENNVVERQHFGVFVTQNAHNARVSGGRIAQSNFGMYAVAYTGGEVSGVEFIGNPWYGLYVETAQKLDISRNTFKDNGTGLSANGNGHRIYHNNFVENRVQASGGYGSTWDAGYPAGGNHWADKTAPDFYSGEFQDQAGSDGFVDDGYPVATSQGVIDRYPFVRADGWELTPEKLFPEIRGLIEGLGTTAIPAPNSRAAEGWRRGLLGKLADAERLYAAGELAGAADTLAALARKCDGQSGPGAPDQIVDDPATTDVDERQAVHGRIVTLIGLLDG